MLKSLIPLPFKRVLRLASDRLNREGSFHEWEGRRDVINRAMITLDFNGITGDYAEFGCCGANTFGYADRAIRRSPRMPRKLWAFDSFEGLPEAENEIDQHPRWIPGTMKTGIEDFRRLCARKGIRNYDVVPGYYDKTLKGAAASLFPVGSIAFAYVDCDVYSSTIDVLEFLLPRLKQGMIVAFDDYWCYDERGLSGERRAFLEVFKASGKWNFETYMPFGWAGMSFVVEAAG